MLFVGAFADSWIWLSLFHGTCIFCHVKVVVLTQSTPHKNLSCSCVLLGVFTCCNRCLEIYFSKNVQPDLVFYSLKMLGTWKQKKS